jgi:hypothetical protein
LSPGELGVRLALVFSDSELTTVLEALLEPQENPEIRQVRLTLAWKLTEIPAIRSIINSYGLIVNAQPAIISILLLQQVCSVP